MGGGYTARSTRAPGVAFLKATVHGRSSPDGKKTPKIGVGKRDKGVWELVKDAILTEVERRRQEMG